MAVDLHSFFCGSGSSSFSQCGSGYFSQFCHFSLSLFNTVPVVYFTMVYLSRRWVTCTIPPALSVALVVEPLGKNDFYFILSITGSMQCVRI